MASTCDRQRRPRRVRVRRPRCSSCVAPRWYVIILYVIVSRNRNICKISILFHNYIITVIYVYYRQAKGFPVSCHIKCSPDGNFVKSCCFINYRVDTCYWQLLFHCFYLNDTHIHQQITNENIFFVPHII